jgi:hypothetical protein
MDQEIRKQLIGLARLKTTWSYSQLNDQLSLGYDFSLVHHRDQIGIELGEISEYEFSKERPLLSALIVHQNDREQGNGFYKLCERLYGNQWEDLKANPRFELDRIAECYSFWRDNGNYKRYLND